jgi:hypothetical protein
MYKIALILSTKPAINVFRAALTRAFTSGKFDEFLICSGFFHERVYKKKPSCFYASAAFAGATLPAHSSVTVVGAYNPASTEFDDFVTTLRTSLVPSSGPPVKVFQRRSKFPYKNPWHAKIFIARNGNNHRFAIVGSSNLTRSAFDATATNNEADVIIWDDSHSLSREIIDAALATQSDQQNDDVSNPTVIISTYDPNDPLNIEHGDTSSKLPKTMNDRLKKLWDDVLDATK